MGYLDQQSRFSARGQERDFSRSNLRA